MLLRARALRARTETQPDPADGLHQEDSGAAPQQQTHELTGFTQESSIPDVSIGQSLDAIPEWNQSVLPVDYSNQWLPEWDAVINGNFYSGCP